MDLVLVATTNNRYVCVQEFGLSYQSEGCSYRHFISQQLFLFYIERQLKPGIDGMGLLTNLLTKLLKAILSEILHTILKFYVGIMKYFIIRLCLNLIATIQSTDKLDILMENF